MCKEREIPVTADDLFHHNGNDFDLKKYNSRLIYHSHGPLPPILCIDRLKEARKIAKFSSNILDYLGTHLVLRAKIETGSQELWDIIWDGNPKALKITIKYCEQDVLSSNRFI